MAFKLKKKKRKVNNSSQSSKELDYAAIDAIEAFIHGNIDKAYEIIKQATDEDPIKALEDPF